MRFGHGSLVQRIKNSLNFLWSLISWVSLYAIDNLLNRLLRCVEFIFHFDVWSQTVVLILKWFLFELCHESWVIIVLAILPFRASLFALRVFLKFFLDFEEPACSERFCLGITLTLAVALILYHLLLLFMLCLLEIERCHVWLKELFFNQIRTFWLEFRVLVFVMLETLCRHLFLRLIISTETRIIIRVKILLQRVEKLLSLPKGFNRLIWKN